MPYLMFISTWLIFNTNSLQCTNGINKYQILEKNCPKDAPQLRRSLSGEKRAFIDVGETSFSALSVSDCRV